MTRAASSEGRVALGAAGTGVGGNGGVRGFANDPQDRLLKRREPKACLGGLRGPHG